MKTFVFEPYLSTPENLSRYFPTYLCQPTTWRCSNVRYAWLVFVQWLLRTVIKIVLRPRRGQVGALDQAEVDAVYSREATTYDRKHHLTTRGQDTMWRRWAGWQITALAARTRNPVKVLDLCTGTGLTVQEVLTVLSGHGVSGEIVGLDYNEAMLRQARMRDLKSPCFDIHFVRGDATNLVFAPETFDVVSQVFGIGGISNPVKVFESVLAVLKEGGVYVLVDMHVPLPDQPGEWPFLYRWWRMPLFETMTYHESTIPLALNRLWGWRDPTLDFYLLPFVTGCEDQNRWWGFEVLSRQIESERWWLGLPIMPVARMVTRKVQISEGEARQRQQILGAISY